MNVLLISQCSKRALVETRRILDQFAERRGDRTWQTAITQEGLDTLRRLLRKTARKNTAVACHWIRGLDHTELLWIVGDASQFSTGGAVPTNTTARDVLRRKDENTWHTGEDIRLIAGLAALLHDLGKASESFQKRLRSVKPLERNQYRHEWVSLRLFQAFVGEDDDPTWLKRLETPSAADDAVWLSRSQRDGLDQTCMPPFKAMRRAPLAQAIGWLVVTHHRLPVLPDARDGAPPVGLGRAVEGFDSGMLDDVLERFLAPWNETPTSTQREVLEPYWTFPHGLPVVTSLWRKRAARFARSLLKLCETSGKGAWLDNPFVMHVSRLCLMLADHHYSKLGDEAEHRTERIKVPDGYPLYANTCGPGILNQTLDEHLLGVARHACDVTHALPSFDEHLPYLARHKGLRKRATDPRFRWQDRAADIAAVIRERTEEQGAFLVNMASTGSGKTLGNARIMNALWHPERGMRCAFAMGLRTLTLQTGRAFQRLLRLGDDELAICVGGGASRDLFDYYEAKSEQTGSASVQGLLPEDNYVCWEGNVQHPLLRRIMSEEPARGFLAAPILVCTIDHLTPATESQRGGRQIAPMLRLMSGDLVLDEPDDFDVRDLPALTRLVHWAGMLGTRVLLSSATLPPSLVQGLFESYRNGREHFQRNRGERPGEGSKANICCAWFDEFDQSHVECAEPAAFEAAHAAFVEKRGHRLAREPVRRKLEILPVDGLRGLPKAVLHQRFAELIREAAAQMHGRHHTVDPRTGKRISFGLVRMANIGPLYLTALALYRLGAPEGLRVHLCTYHSQYPLLYRSEIEHQLDRVLDRRNPLAVFDLPDIRARIDPHPDDEHIFIVLSSPVAEVGRDHDFDWAIVEPSSMRSLIQLAGRVWRHRPDKICDIPNIAVFDTSLRYFLRGKDARFVFCKPGFEGPDFELETHFLHELLRDSEINVVDSRPRALEVLPNERQPGRRLTDLEHGCIRHAMQRGLPTQATNVPGTRTRPASAPAPNAATWWSLSPRDALLTAILPQQQPFRADAGREVEVILEPSEDDPEQVHLKELMRDQSGKWEWVSVEKPKHHRIPDHEVQGLRMEPWCVPDYVAALHQLSEEWGVSIAQCARRVGVATLPHDDEGWTFHPALGFRRGKWLT